MLAPPPLTSKFVGMASYAPASFHDLVDDEVESDGSSVGDVVAPSHPLSWECAMADALCRCIEQAPASKFIIMRVRPRWCAKGHKVYTGSG